MNEKNPAPGGLSQHRILLVEDDRMMRKYLEAQLAGLGCTILQASTGQEGLFLAQTARPDVVLLDAVLPAPDGFQICQQLKSDPATRDIAVIMLTSLGADAKDRSFSAGADDFLTKPPHFVELRARIRNHLAIRALQLQLQRERGTEGFPLWEPGRQSRIVVVESHDKLGELMARELEQAGHEVRLADSLQACRALLAEGIPDALVLDHYLSDGDGLAFSVHLRQWKAVAELPILLVCARRNLELEIKGLESGPTDILSKPFAPFELRTRMAVLLRHGLLSQGVDPATGAPSRRLILDPHSGLHTVAFLEAHLSLLWQSRATALPALAAFRVPAGPGLAKELAGTIALLKGAMAPGDLLCRVGERTFVAAFPALDTPALQMRLEGIRAAGFKGISAQRATLPGEGPVGALKFLAASLVELEGRALASDRP